MRQSNRYEGVAMELSKLFLQRHDVLHSFWLDEFERCVAAELRRVRPHPRVNSIAWSLWHIARVEDVSVNRFVADQPQILDLPWRQRLRVDLRHHGAGMTFAEVDDLSQQIDLAALHAYRHAVALRTREVVATIDQIDLNATLGPEPLRAILEDEGVAHPAAAGLFENYLGWTKGRSLMALGLTHGFEHVGEIGVIASLLGVELD